MVAVLTFNPIFYKIRRLWLKWAARVETPFRPESFPNQYWATGYQHQGYKDEYCLFVAIVILYRKSLNTKCLVCPSLISLSCSAAVILDDIAP